MSGFSGSNLGYVYPLKFLFTLLLGRWFGLTPHAGGEHGFAITGTEVPTLMAIYAAGFVAVFGLFVLLYWVAWRRRDRLGLDRIERHDTIASLVSYGAYVAIGLVSLTFALLGKAGFSGLTYMLIGPTQAAVGYGFGSRRPKREESDE